jgi:hypothetical protein
LPNTVATHPLASASKDSAPDAARLREINTIATYKPRFGGVLLFGDRVEQRRSKRAAQHGVVIDEKISGNPNKRCRMRQTLTNTCVLENADYRGTGGVSENNRRLGFQPAFIDRETCTVYLSRFADGRLAPCHLLDGLPAELVLARSEQGHVARVKASVVSGFVHDEHFYTRDEAAAALVSTPDFDLSRSQETSLRWAA